jgi:hypothetical protein
MLGHKVDIHDIPPFFSFTLDGLHKPELCPPIWSHDLRLSDAEWRPNDETTFTLSESDEGSADAQVSCIVSLTTRECRFLLFIPTLGGSPLATQMAPAPEETMIQKARQIGRHRGVWHVGFENVVLFSDQARIAQLSGKDAHVFRRVDRTKYGQSTEGEIDKICVDEARGRVCIRFGSRWQTQRNPIEVWDFA